MQEVTAAPRPPLHKQKGQTGEGAKQPAAHGAAGAGAAGSKTGSQAKDGGTPPLKARAAQQPCFNLLSAGGLDLRACLPAGYMLSENSVMTTTEPKCRQPCAGCLPVAGHGQWAVLAV